MSILERSPWKYCGIKQNTVPWLFQGDLGESQWGDPPLVARIPWSPQLGEVWGPVHLQLPEVSVVFQEPHLVFSANQLSAGSTCPIQCWPPQPVSVGAEWHSGLFLQEAALNWQYDKVLGHIHFCLKKTLLKRSD